MATFNVLCSNRFLFKGGKFPEKSSRTLCSRNSEINVCVARSKNQWFSCRRLGGFLEIGETKLGVRVHGDYRNGFSCNSEIKRLVNGDYGDKETRIGENGGSKGKRRRFSLRLRPRLRLLSMRLGRFDFRASMEDFRLFLRKNVKRVILSTGVAVIFGLCYLFLRLTAVPSPSIVPYSDFVTNLRGGSVSKVLLEEGSRRIYYNTNQNVEVVEDVHKSETLEEPVNVGTVETVTESVTKDVTPRKVRALTPVWKYVTRKVDHDEKFLLSLMREKGITYSSAPQSALVSMRTTLITIISLWIPLTPLMWLLYRQLSASNSPAKKRRSNNPTVGFDDVEGVDSAKDELVEVKRYANATFFRFKFEIQLSFVLVSFSL